MKRVCAWCNSKMGTVRVKATDAPCMVTHSICSDCSDNLDFQLGVTLHRYLDSLKIPIVALNEKGRIIGINHEASKIYAGGKGEKIADWPHKVFECAHARLPQGCSNRVHCSGCAIRLVVTDCYRTGTSLRDTPAHITHCDSDAPEQAELLISADKIDKIVFLRIVSADNG